MDPEAAICPRCGGMRPRGTPEGLCPVCLLASVNADNDLQDSGIDDRECAPIISSDPAAGRWVGNYELIEEIGHGGMGIVYRARQRGLNRVVALKMVLANRFAGPDAKARFRAEAELAAQLQHPGIVAIHDIGEHEGEPFFSMDYVDGRSLSELVREQPLPSRAAAGYVKAVAEAIHYAHQHGVLHRDLKPSNILIDASDSPRITDFGLAKRIDTESDLTLTGQVLGSPSYAAPEQVMGWRDRIGPAADVYSLGAVLYHLLARRPPFVTDTLGATLQLVQHAEPLPVRRLNPGVPRDLETICLKCLEKDIARRYLSAAALAQDLGRFLNGEPISAKPPGIVGRAARWCHRKPVVAGLLAASLALALTVMIGSPIAIYRIEKTRRALEHEAYSSNIRLAKNYIDQGDVDQALAMLTNCPAAQRHWEWGYLMAMCHQEVRSLQAFPPPDHITSRPLRLVFGPQHDLLVSIVQGGSLQLWQHSSGRELRRWGEPTNQVTDASFHPEGHQLAIAFANSPPEIWSVLELIGQGTSSSSKPTALVLLPAPPQSATRLAWSRDGTRLLTGGKGPTQLWNVASSMVEKEFSGRAVPADHVSFSPDERRVLAWGQSSLTVWDRATGKRVAHRVPDYSRGQFALHPDPTGTLWAVSDQSNVFSLVVSNQTIPLITAPELDEQGLAQRAVFSPDSTLVCNSGEPGTARVWNTRDGREQFAIPLRVRRARFSPDGRLLATSGGTHYAVIWDAATGKEWMRLHGHSGLLDELQFSPDGRLVATMDQRGTIKIWATSPGRTRLQHPQSVRALDFSPDGRRLVAASDHAGLFVWNPDSGECLTIIRGPPETIYSVVHSPDGQWLASVGAHRLVRLWDALSGDRIRSWEAHERWIPQATFDRDGRRLFTYSAEGEMKVWNPLTGRLELGIETGLSPMVPCAAMARDGQWLANVDSAGRLLLWNTSTKQHVARSLGHSNAVYSLAFTPDSRSLVTCSIGGESRLWERSTLETKATWSSRGTDFPVVFSDDGRRLFASSIRYDGRGYDQARLVVRDSIDGQELLSIEYPALPLSLAYTAASHRLALGTIEGRVHQLEAFPWRERDYPGAATLPLPQRIRLYADAYWTKRLGTGRAGEERTTDAGHNLPRIVTHAWEPWLFPARESNAPNNQLDLSAFYTSPLTRKHHPMIDFNHYADLDLRRMPRGLVTFEGVPFDVRGVIQLALNPNRVASYNGWDHIPRQVNDIPVRQKCRRIHVLHGCVHPTGEGEVIGRYVLHYANQTTAICNIAHGLHVRTLDCAKDSDPRADAIKEGRIAWMGSSPSAETTGFSLRVYLSTYPNPHPDQEIAALDFVSECGSAGPFLIAVTLE